MFKGGGIELKSCYVILNDCKNIQKILGDVGCDDILFPSSWIVFLVVGVELFLVDLEGVYGELFGGKLLGDVHCILGNKFRTYI